MNDIIFKNWLIDLRKEELHPIERAVLIRDYMERHNHTIRSIAEEIGYSKSKIHNLLLWDRINIDDYDNLKEQGYSRTEIFRLLRKGTNLKKNELKEYDIFIKNTIINVKKYIYIRSLTSETENLVRELINQLNRSLIKKKTDK